MQKRILAIGVMCVFAAGLAFSASRAVASPAERYLHVRVQNGAKGESVNVNVPLSMAEKILPTVNNGNLHNGRVSISQLDLQGVDVKTILDAIRTAPDNEFVSIKDTDQDVHVMKSNGSILIRVRNANKGGERVDITVPMKVVDALFSTVKDNELDVAAALRALDEAGETLLVTVEDATEHVHIWVDSHNTSE